MADQEIVGPWKRIKILGYGGFGQVTLWYKKETEEYIGRFCLHEMYFKLVCHNVTIIFLKFQHLRDPKRMCCQEKLKINKWKDGARR